MLRIFEIERPILNLNEYEINDLIGASGYSNVFKAIHKITHKEYAFKFTSLIDNDVYDSIIALDLIRSYNFPTLLQNYGFFYFAKYNDIPHFLREKFIGFTSQSSNFFIIVNEYMKNGNLYDYIRYNKTHQTSINSVIRYKIIYGIAFTMKMLHSIHLFHRDLKTSHIFLNENYEPIISLCHTSKFLISENEEQTPMIGTPMYIAPEVINGGFYDFKADVYSFAIIVLAMFTYKIEFDDGSLLSAYIMYSKISSGERYKKPSLIPDSYWNLIQDCWKQNANERPSFNDIIKILKGDEFISGQFKNQSELDDIEKYLNNFENKFCGQIQ